VASVPIYILLIMFDVVCEGGKYLETPSNVILLLPIWHSPPLGQVIKGLDYSTLVVDHLLDTCFPEGHVIVSLLFCCVNIQLSIRRPLHLGLFLEYLPGGLMTIRLSVRLFMIYHRFFW
jgi:hypothetical protein